MSMPKHSIGLGGVLSNVRAIRMDSKASEREPPEPDLWQITIEGYMAGVPVSLDQVTTIKNWLEAGGLLDICNLLRRDSNV